VPGRELSADQGVESGDRGEEDHERDHYAEECDRRSHRGRGRGTEWLNVHREPPYETVPV
jgi:hypothetical protein